MWSGPSECIKWVSKERNETKLNYIPVGRLCNLAAWVAILQGKHDSDFIGCAGHVPFATRQRVTADIPQVNRLRINITFNSSHRYLWTINWQSIRISGLQKRRIAAVARLWLHTRLQLGAETLEPWVGTQWNHPFVNIRLHVCNLTWGPIFHQQCGSCYWR